MHYLHISFIGRPCAYFPFPDVDKLKTRLTGKRMVATHYISALLTTNSHVPWHLHRKYTDSPIVPGCDICNCDIIKNNIVILLAFIIITYKNEMKWLVFEAKSLHCKVKLAREQPGLMRWNFVMNHSPGAGSISRPVDQKNGCPRNLQYYYLQTYNACILIFTSILSSGQQSKTFEYPILLEIC